MIAASSILLLFQLFFIKYYIVLPEAALCAALLSLGARRASACTGMAASILASILTRISLYSMLLLSAILFFFLILYALPSSQSSDAVEIHIRRTGAGVVPYLLTYISALIASFIALSLYIPLGVRTTSFFSLLSVAAVILILVLLSYMHVASS